MVNLHEFYTNIDEEGYGSFEFEKGAPLNSLAQLLSVLPPQSAKLLPKPLAELMVHPSSPLTEYYPADFISDANGKRQSWEAVVHIPFIEADLLVDTVNKIIDADNAGQELLTNSERRRNVMGTSHLFIPPGLTEEERVKLEEQQRRLNLAHGRGKPRQRQSASQRSPSKSNRRRTTGESL
jgi:hypothetical protein